VYPQPSKIREHRVSASALAWGTKVMVVRFTAHAGVHDIALESRSRRTADIPPEAVLDTFIAVTAPAAPAVPA
jgi:hypothetical protein